MNKKLLLGALCSLAIMACTKTEEVKVEKNDAISFRTSLNTATRAETNLSNLAAFNVTSFTGTEANFFENLAVTSSDQGLTWTTASTYYWPATGTYKFYAYAPQALNTKVTINKDEQKIAGLSPERNITQAKDVVVAYNTGDKAGNASSGVALNFKHVYAQVKVEAKCSDENYQIKVLGVKLANMNSTCDFTMPSEETVKGYTIPEGNWASLATPVAYGDIKQAASAKTLTTSYQSIMTGADNFFVLPQAITAWDGSASKTGNYIAVICQISRKDASGTSYIQMFPAAAGKYAGACVGISAPAKLMAGKRYTYKLEFFGTGGGAGKVDPDPTHNGNDTGNGDGNPDNNDGSQNNPDIDTTPGTGGDDIVGQAIKFTVTVDDWVDGDTTEIQL